MVKRAARRAVPSSWALFRQVRDSRLVTQDETGGGEGAVVRGLGVFVAAERTVYATGRGPGFGDGATVLARDVGELVVGGGQGRHCRIHAVE